MKPSLKCTFQAMRVQDARKLERFNFHTIEHAPKIN